MYFPDKPIELLERQYFTIRRAAEATGLQTSVIRYWGTRSEKIKAIKRTECNQRRFLGWQVVMMLGVRAVVDDLGMGLDGAIDLMSGVDIESFMQNKRRSGIQWFCKQDMKELLRTSLARKVGGWLGDDEAVPETNHAANRQFSGQQFEVPAAA